MAGAGHPPLDPLPSQGQALRGPQGEPAPPPGDGLPVGVRGDGGQGGWGYLGVMGVQGTHEGHPYGGGVRSR